MEVDQLTDEQIANLTPEQIEMLENDPGKIGEILDAQEAANQVPEETTSDQSDQKGHSAADSALNDENEDEPVVLTKSGKGIIPYEKHKALRVENSVLREQLQTAQSKLDGLLKHKDKAGSKTDVAEADDAIGSHLETLRDEMPELHQVISAVLEGSRKQGEKLEQTLEELKREKEESERAKQLSVAEQVAEAKDNNPDLVHWEGNDPEAWDEALRQDEILRTNSKWTNKPYAERFDEVVRRVRAIVPEASLPRRQSDPGTIKAEAKARLERAPARKPTTLSDIQGGAPATVSDEISAMSPHELTRKLMSMPAHKAAALRAELD
ncbi:hypothetical protein [Nitrosovibrio tenuis]|uniref:Uncharacterized protein n=1 Tax=Nitrosovibrio tenuis TaxID=1233 RepID=A0A1H7IP28_9PROT|nr:hypothetical protein [Nitrosovibrio tenuis]SEK64196.1 hypothetical protein SAMN05216387_102249 [Nitrosovibrio tenuis]